MTTTFEPVNTSNFTLAITCALIAIGTLAFLFYSFKKDKNKDKSSPVNKFSPVISLLVFIVFLLSVSTAFFSWLTTTKISTVTINEEYIETDWGKVTWDNVDRIYIHEDKQISPFTGREYGDIIKFLMIVETNGKTRFI